MDILLGVAALALVAASVGRYAAHRKIRALRDKLERAVIHANKQSHIVSQMRTEQALVASLALVLPSVIRELNSYDLNLRRVPGMILQLAEAIFQPGQILFYRTVMVSSPHGNHRELRLIAHRGFEELPESLRRIAPGEGKIGWVAEHKVDMLYEDWADLERTDKIVVEDNHPLLKTDVVGPLLHATVEGDQILGVLCLGSTGIRPRDEKLMFQLVKNMSSLAMVTAQQKSRLADQANHDYLTGLLNMRSFKPKLGEMIVEAERAERPMGLLIFDIDDFSAFNSSNGHVAADELLRELGELLRNSVRPDDVCCRWGGEKFMVAMPDSDRTATFGRAEQVRSAIEGCSFPREASQPASTVTMSGGVAIALAEGTDVTSLITVADKRLYESKRLGGNRISLET